jgi:diguanylate cyclase (GGDEF)-like protein
MSVCAEIELGDAADLAEALRALIEATSFGLPIPVTASFGVAQYEPGEQIESLISRADKQLYVAKETGRNRVAAAR